MNLNPIKWMSLKDRAEKVGKKRFSDLIRYQVHEQGYFILNKSLSMLRLKPARR